MDAARKKTEKRLRAKLLLVLSIGSRNAPTGHVPGRMLVDQAAGIMTGGQRFDSDDHALGLMRDLVNAGYATESPLGQRRVSQRFGIDWVRYAITDKGTRLVEQDASEPPHPLIEDDRQLDE